MVAPGSMHGRVRRRGRAGTAQSNHMDGTDRRVCVYAQNGRVKESLEFYAEMVPSGYIGLEDTMRLTSSTCRPALASHPSGRPRPATRLHDRRRSAQTEHNLLGACWTQQNTEVVEQAAKMVRWMDGKERKSACFRNRVSALGHVLCQMRRSIELKRSLSLMGDLKMNLSLMHLWMILNVSFVSLYRKGNTSVVVVGAMERKATTHVGSWLSLSCVPSPAKQTETLGPLLKRKIKTAADQAASMLMPPPSSKCLYKHKAMRQLGGDLLMNMAETAAPLLKWMQNEADEAAVRTMVPAPSSENLYKHEAMGQLGGDLLMNLDEASVPLLKWIKNDPDEAAVKMMVPPPSSENLLKHKATGQWVTETAKPSLVKRIATAADEASAEAATKLLPAPPSDAYISSSPRTSRAKLPKSIAKDLNAGRRGKISLVMESEGLTVEGRYSVSPTDGRLVVTSRWKKFIDGAKLRIGSKLKVKIFRCHCDMLVIKFAVV
ncbi:hypothetical protein QYE76_028760 [Lolium multiflorum]|uniref:Uncharacterized protein n=1 Tax=Lolium multiflorum TaxID=4521 RepID=A0AAD8VEW3_LOLMU|nr:hypothetical protein QYE76_028760 [Lolium multiflorum]